MAARNSSDERLGVRSVSDVAGERDGCDRCGCPDEEVCCPAFWYDEGVPPVPVLSWVFARKNRFLNDNACVGAIGNCGLRAADRERKALMGTALAATVFSMVVTTWGCFSLSPNTRISQATAWALGWLTTDGGTGTIVYVGLRTLVISHCSDAPTDEDPLTWSGCSSQDWAWEDVNRRCAGAAGDLPFGYPCDTLVRCSEQAVANQFGAFVTCITLLFALAGCLTRIRKRADSNFQKIIGIVPDFFGLLSLGSALSAFGNNCTVAMVDHADLGTGYAAGPGYIGYSCCWVAALVRFSMHLLLPVPGGGCLSAPPPRAAADVSSSKA